MEKFAQFQISKMIANIVVVVLSVLAFPFLAVNAEADCNKPPNMMNVKDCCKIPEPNWIAYKSKCSDPNLPNSRKPNPCFLECIFNASGALNGQSLNLPQVEIMLTNLFDGKQDFVKAYMTGFQKCEPLIQERLENFKGKSKKPMPKSPGCQLLGTFYAMCAHKMVFISCPDNAWTSKKECDAAREYATSCDPKIGGPGGRRGTSGSKRVRREVTETSVDVYPSQQTPMGMEGQTQQNPNGLGPEQGQRRGGQRRGGGYGYGGPRRGQRPGMDNQNGGQQLGQPMANGPPRRGQGMRQRNGPNGQGPPMPMGQPGMGGPAQGQGMRQGIGPNGPNQQRRGRRRMGQGQGQGQGQEQTNVENIGQENGIQSQRR